MVNGLSLFEELINQIKVRMEEANNSFNSLFADLNLPFTIEAVYDQVQHEDNIEIIQNTNMEEEEENNERNVENQNSAHLQKIRARLERIEQEIANGNNKTKKKV